MECVETFHNSMKIVLVSPSQRHLTDPIKAEPLGLMYIETALQRLGLEVECVDMSFDTKIPEADLYGFSASTVNFPKVVEYAKQLKSAYTIIGGSHASALPNQARSFFDAVVVGPGENVLEEVIRDFKTNRKGGIFCKSMTDIDSIPIPLRTIRNRIPYNPFDGERNSASLITSRGCPFQCSFCASNAIWGRKVLFRSLDSVLTEISYLQETYGISSFKFVDDIFVLNKKRFLSFSHALSDLKIKWFCEMRMDSIDDLILDHMIASGCTTVDLGVESVDDIVLQKIQKKQTVKSMKKAIHKIQEKGLKVKIYLIYGLPFEPSDIVTKMMGFIEEVNPDFVSLFTFVPYPGTDIYEHPEKYNIKWMDSDFSRYQHSIGQIQEEQDWLPCVEYFDREREKLREERNQIKNFTIRWNEQKKRERK